MTAAESLREFVEALECAGVPYMLTGSYASSYHALPRATRDLDFVIWPSREQIRALVAQLPRSEFYVDEQAALEALDSHGQFNMISLTSGWKADFIIRKPRQFSETEFNRRYRANLGGIELTIATAEDVLHRKARMGEARGVESSDRGCGGDPEGTARTARPCVSERVDPIAWSGRAVACGASHRRHRLSTYQGRRTDSA